MAVGRDVAGARRKSILICIISDGWTADLSLPWVQKELCKQRGCKEKANGRSPSSDLAFYTGPSISNVHLALSDDGLR